VYVQGGVYTVTLRLSDGTAVATATTTAYVTGVGLHNGQLYIVGTNGDDSVSLNNAGGRLKVKTNLMQRFEDFNSTDVVAVHMVLGAGNDSVSLGGRSLSQPVYLNGQLYGDSSATTTATGTKTNGRKGLFSDVLLAA
jgi:hypothetical protein